MTDQTQVQRVESVLKQIRELKEEDEKAAKATGKNFNVFSLPGFGYNELDHSAFLANLLNPKGTHSQGPVFLRYFLKQLDSFDYENPEDFKVAREAYVGGYGQIDILLEKNDACIIIENKIDDEDRKIDAEDQAGQLNRYYMYAKERFTDERIKLIYLTPNGRRPSEDSLRGEDGQKPLDANRVICISYKSDIIKWLEDCLKEVVKIAPIREVLFQYQENIKKLTDLPTREDFFKDKIRDILTDNYHLLPELKNSILTDSCDLLSELKDFIPNIEEAIQSKFWKRLEEKVTEVCNIKRCDSVETEIIFKIPRGELCPPFEIALRVKLERGLGVCYGFVLLENGSRVEKCNQKEFEEYATLVHRVLKPQKGQGGPSPGMLGWKYPKYQNRVILFSDVERMRNVIEDDELAKLVETVAREIEPVVKDFIKAKKEANL